MDFKALLKPILILGVMALFVGVSGLAVLCIEGTIDHLTVALNGGKRYPPDREARH